MRCPYRFTCLVSGLHVVQLYVDMCCGKDQLFPKMTGAARSATSPKFFPWKCWAAKWSNQIPASAHEPQVKLSWISNDSYLALISDELVLLLPSCPTWVSCEPYTQEPLQIDSSLRSLICDWYPWRPRCVVSTKGSCWGTKPMCLKVAISIQNWYLNHEIHFFSSILRFIYMYNKKHFMI